MNALRHAGVDEGFLVLILRLIFGVTEPYLIVAPFLALGPFALSLVPCLFGSYTALEILQGIV